MSERAAFAIAVSLTLLVAAFVSRAGALAHSILP
jgi:hypothetical protein